MKHGKPCIKKSLQCLGNELRKVCSTLSPPLWTAPKLLLGFRRNSTYYRSLLSPHPPHSICLSDSHSHTPAYVQIIVCLPSQPRLQVLLSATICFTYCIASCPSAGHIFGAQETFFLYELYNLYMLNIWYANNVGAVATRCGNTGIAISQRFLTLNPGVTCKRGISSSHPHPLSHATATFLAAVTLAIQFCPHFLCLPLLTTHRNMMPRQLHITTLAQFLIHL